MAFFGALAALGHHGLGVALRRLQMSSRHEQLVLLALAVLGRGKTKVLDDDLEHADGARLRPGAHVHGAVGARGHGGGVAGVHEVVVTGAHVHVGGAAGDVVTIGMAADPGDGHEQDNDLQHGDEQQQLRSRLAK